MWEESSPLACEVGVGTAVLSVGDTQFLYSLGDDEIKDLRIPLAGPSHARLGRPTWAAGMAATRSWQHDET
jgi:hypothetical protein